MITKMVMRMRIIATVVMITIMVILMTRRWLMVMIVIYSCFH